MTSAAPSPWTRTRRVAAPVVAKGTSADALTERGQRTRERLLAAAREVFEREGYHKARA